MIRRESAAARSCRRVSHRGDKMNDPVRGHPRGRCPSLAFATLARRASTRLPDEQCRTRRATTRPQGDSHVVARTGPVRGARSGVGHCSGQVRGFHPARAVDHVRGLAGPEHGGAGLRHAHRDRARIPAEGAPRRGDHRLCRWTEAPPLSRSRAWERSHSRQHRLVEEQVPEPVDDQVDATREAARRQVAGGRWQVARSLPRAVSWPFAAHGDT